MAEVVRRFRESPDTDYVSNKINWTYPLGLTAELLSRRAIEYCHAQLTDARERELVADWIRDQPELFKRQSVEQAVSMSHLGWTLDEPEDYTFLRTVFDALYEDGTWFGMQAVLDFVSEPAMQVHAQ